MVPPVRGNCLKIAEIRARPHTDQTKGPPEGGPLILIAPSLRVVARFLGRLFRLLFGCHFGLRRVALAGGVAALRRRRRRASGLVRRLRRDGRRDEGEGGGGEDKSAHQVDLQVFFSEVFFSEVFFSEVFFSEVFFLV